MSNSIHSASGSFLGYLVQIERLMLWVSISDVNYVQLETDDDIVSKLKNGDKGLKILEQAKNSSTDKIPFQDSSVDLWKTLSIWVKQRPKDKNYEHISYSIYSNKKLPPSRLICKVVKYKNEPENFESSVLKLLAKAKKQKTTTKPYADIVLSCPIEELKLLLKKVSICDDEIDRKTLKERVRSNLGIGLNLPIDLIYQSLLGYVIDNVIHTWKNGGDYTLERESILNESNRLISQYLDKPFIEKAVDSLPRITSVEIEKNKERNFVRQLKLINANENEIIKSINNFLRAESEKDRYASDGEIMESSFLNYYKDLFDQWERIFNPKSRLLKGSHPPEDIGYQIFYETLSYKGKLNGHEPQQEYTFQGAYHSLSDKLELGWNPNWEKLLKEKND